MVHLLVTGLGEMLVMKTSNLKNTNYNKLKKFLLLDSVLLAHVQNLTEQENSIYENQ